MIDPQSFREAFEDAPLDKIIKERDKLIREIRRYEKDGLNVIEMMYEV